MRIVIKNKIFVKPNINGSDCWNTRYTLFFIKQKKSAVIKGMLKIMHYKNEHWRLISLNFTQFTELHPTQPLNDNYLAHGLYISG